MERDGTGMPRGIGNAYAFQVFNTISYSIVLTTPMILFLKYLGASAAVIGVAAAMTPFFSILQIPAANVVERVGYRTFVVRGWVARSVFILGIAAVSLLPDSVSASLRMALIVLFLAAFSAARGFVVCGFLPWITQLIPPERRGAYVSRDQMFNALALTGTMAGTAAYFAVVKGRVAFPLLFAFSYVSALVSLFFLRRFPDVEPPPPSARGGRVPWRELLLHPPFLRLVRFNFVVFLFLSAGGVFWIPMLRDLFATDSRTILLLSSLGSVIGAGTLFGFGRVVDRVGSLPLLGVSGLALGVAYLGWAALAAGVLPYGAGSLVFLMSAGGLGGALFNMANTRLVMATVPLMGRSHFFALFSVINNLTLGLAPVLWGLVLDSLGGWSAHLGPWSWNRYSMLFAMLSLGMVAAQPYRRRVPEPRAMSTDDFLHEMLVRTPSRALIRFLHRRP